MIYRIVYEVGRLWFSPSGLNSSWVSNKIKVGGQIDLKALDGLQASWLWNVKCIVAYLHFYLCPERVHCSPQSHTQCSHWDIMLYTKLGGNFPTKIKACIFSRVLHVEFLPNKVYSVDGAQSEGIQMYHSFKRSIHSSKLMETKEEITGTSDL